MRRNSFEKIILLIIILNSLAACTTLRSEESAKSPLRVAYSESWGDYTLLIAKEKGLFEKYGVEVEPVYYKIVSKKYSDLAAGQIDGALIGVGDAIKINYSSDMKIISISDDGGMDAIIGRSEINSIEDLKGKKIGVPLGTQYELVIKDMLRSANMDSSEVILVGIEPKNALFALKNNQVQAAYTWEPFISDAISNGNKIIYSSENLRLFPDVIVFNALIVEDRPEDIRAFMLAWFEAVEYRQQNQQETRAIAAKYLDVDIEKIQVDDNMTLLSLEENKAMFDVQKEDSIYVVTKRTSEYLISIGAIAQQFDPLELIDPDYLP